MLKRHGWLSLLLLSAALSCSPAYAFSHECSKLIDNPPRGLACLHCAHPKAKNQSTRLVRIQKKACLGRTAINYLVDDSFVGEDEKTLNVQRLKNQIDRLTENGQELHLELYLQNGSRQRRFGNPGKYRKEFATSKKLQREHEKYINRIMPVVLYALDRGAYVYIVPWLEDNLDNPTFNAVAKFTKAKFPKNPRIKFGRNACKGCYPGNETAVPKGWFRESHSKSDIPTKGIFTNDGDDYALSELRKVRDEAGKKHALFILWDAERQGRRDIDGVLVGYEDPNDRVYQTPSAKEERELIRFLRGGVK